MKKNIAPALSIVFFIGILIVGVGMMSVYFNWDYISEYQRIETNGSQAEVKIIKKGTSRSGGGSSSRNITYYFHLPYLGGTQLRDFTIVYPTPQEYDAFNKGALVTVVYDPEDPGEAYLVKTPDQLWALRSKSFKVIFFGLGLVVIAVFFSRRFPAAEKTQ